MNEKHLNILSDQELLKSAESAAKNERHATTSVLHHLREIERRRLFAILGYGSLFDYCVKCLGYSESSAQRRIASMRLLQELPEIEAKIQNGKLSLSVVAQAQTFFRNEAKVEQGYTIKEKRDLLEKLEGTSTREAEKSFLSLSSHPVVIRPEKMRQVSETLSEIRFLADKTLLDELETLKGLLAHKHGNLGVGKLVEILAKMALERLDPAKNPKITRSLPAQKPTETRRIPSTVRREVWRKDRGQCSFIEIKTGLKCNSKYALQIDHVKPWSMGGTHALDNLRLLCFQHNQRAAIEWFGLEKIENVVRRQIP